MHSEFSFTSTTLVALLIVIFSQTAAAVFAHPLDSSDWLSNPIHTVDLEGGSGARFAVSGSNVYVVWDSNGVKFAKSSDNGTTFSEPLTLGDRDPNSAVGLYPTVAANRDRVYVVFSSGLDIFLVKSEDGGENFDEPVNISKTQINSPYAVSEQIISVGDINHVYITWTVGSGSWSEIYLAQSSDGGITFGEPKNISDSPNQPSQFPKIASLGKQVYLVWYDIDEFYGGYHVSFAGSVDGGATFRRVNNLSANSQSEFAFEPNVAIGNDDAVYVTWRDNAGEDGAPKVNFAKSTDSGSTFQFKRALAIGGWPALAVQGDNVYIAYGIQDNNGTDNVGFISSLDGGKTFASPLKLTNQTWALDYRDERAFPVIEADGANVYVAWRYTADAEGNHETFLAASYDEGITFSKPLNLSRNGKIGEGNTSTQPALTTVPHGRVFVVWEEYVAERGAVMLARGQIPEEYAEPYRQEGGVSSPIVLYDSSQQFLPPIIGVGAAIAAVVAFLKLRKRNRK